MSQFGQHLRWFGVGRPWYFAVGCYVAVLVLTYFFWFAPIATYLTGQNFARFVSILEAGPSLAAGVMLACLTPRVAMWDALGTRKLQWLSTCAAGLAIMALAAVPTLVHTVLANQPISQIPGFNESFNSNPTASFAAAAPIESYLGWAGNIWFFAGIAAACCALLGPVLGVLGTWASFIGVLYLQSSETTRSYVPLISTMKDISTVNLLVGGAVALAGLCVWHKSHAARPWARRFSFM